MAASDLQKENKELGDAFAKAKLDDLPKTLEPHLDDLLAITSERGDTHPASKIFDNTVKLTKTLLLGQLIASGSKVKLITKLANSQPSETVTQKIKNNVSQHYGMPESGKFKSGELTDTEQKEIAEEIAKEISEIEKKSKPAS